MKKLRIFWLTAAIVLLFAYQVYAQATIDVATNGSSAAFDPGWTVMISGQLSDDGTPLSNNYVTVTVNNPDNSTNVSVQVKTDKNGYYHYIMSAPETEGTYYVTAAYGQVTGSTKFSIPATAEAKNRTLDFGDSGYSTSASQSTLQVGVVPVSTSQFALVFNRNVNYFVNKKNESYPIAENEGNEDCIKLYKGTTITDANLVAADVVLVDSDRLGNKSYSYYQNETNVDKSTERKKVIVVEPTNALEPSTAYTILIDGGLSANSGNLIGNDVRVTFNTAADGTVVPTTGGVGGTGGAGGTSLPEVSSVIAAKDIGQITTDGGVARLMVDTQKALEALKANTGTAIGIDISLLTGTSSAQRAVQMPSQVIDAVRKDNKSIVLQNGDLAIVIPPTALIEGKDMTISLGQADRQTLPAAPEQVDNTVTYEFDAQVGSEQTHSFSQSLTITLPVPSGVKNPEKLGVYYLNETTGQWEYMGGKIVDGKLVFTTNHFSKYMVAESTKTFTDIASHWAKSDIEVMVARHIINGVDSSTFAPQSSITRAEFAALLSRVLKLTDTAGNSTFKDVKGSEWYADDVNRAAKAGIILGSDGSFRPGDKITRQEMAVMIMRAYAYTGSKVDSLKELTFTDKASVSSWANDSVKGVYTLGIIKGRTDGSFGALDNATRAEGTVMLKILMDKLGL